MRRNIEALRDGTFDLCILGGGITGAGAALDAVTRGWRVALIDKNDFAAGTSSASSKLVHGGLRYLEYGHLPLVHEALLERGRLLRNASHLVQPLPFVVPFYDGQRLRPWQWRLGLTLYDLLAGRGNIARSRPLSRRHLHTSLPQLHAAKLLGGALFYDALMDDARVCITVLKTAAGHGAVLANYLTAVDFEKAHGTIVGVWALDRLTGQTLLIRCRAVLNATGPWADKLARLAGDESGPLLAPTKGVHLIVPARDHPCAFLLLHPRDGRVFFVIPWLGKTLLGTTDTLPEASPDSLTVQPSEIEYLLEGFNHHLDPPLAAADVMGAFAGLRPLVRSRQDEPSARPREFHIHVSPSGLISALGGKYTTYRHMAETIVDFIGARLNQGQRCRTHQLPLFGAPEQPWPDFLAAEMAALQREYPIAADSAVHLLRRHGTQARAVLAAIGQTPGGFARVHAEEPDLIGEQTYLRAEEMAIFPEDIYLRRSRLGMWRRL